MKHLVQYILEQLDDVKSLSDKMLKDLSKKGNLKVFVAELNKILGKTQSGWGEKNSYAFEIKYNQHLSLVIDFINRVEFIYKWLEDGDIFYEIDSTYEIRNIDNWDEMLDPKQYIRAKSRVLSTPKKREKLLRLMRCVNKLKELV